MWDTLKESQKRNFGKEHKGFPGACNAGDPGSVPGWGKPLEKEMTTYSSILAWRSPRTEESDGLQSMRPQRVRHNRATKHTHTQETLRNGQSFCGDLVNFILD